MTTTPQPDELRQEIEQTRAELADTVEALAAKVDVKAQVKDSAARVTTLAAGQAAKVGEIAAEAVGEAGAQVSLGVDAVRRAVGTPEVTIAGRRIPVRVAFVALAALVAAIWVARSARR